MAGWRAESPSAGSVVLAGDSLAAGFPVVELEREAGTPVLLRGTPGETIHELRARVGEVLDREPRVLVLQTGTNDAIRGRRVASIGRRHAALLALCRDRLPDARIVVLALPPASAVRVSPGVVRRVNGSLEAAASRYDATFVDTYEILAEPGGEPRVGTSTDGVHLTPDGYAAVTTCLLPHLRP